MSRSPEQFLREHVSNQAVQVCQLLSHLEFLNEVLAKVKERLGSEELDAIIQEATPKPAGQ